MIHKSSANDWSGQNERKIREQIEVNRVKLNPELTVNTNSQ